MTARVAEPTCYYGTRNRDKDGTGMTVLPSYHPANGLRDDVCARIKDACRHDRDNDYKSES